MAVADARKHVLEAAHWVAPSRGGRGAGCDAVEFLLESRGILNQVVEQYLVERTGTGTGQAEEFASTQASKHV